MKSELEGINNNFGYKMHCKSEYHTQLSLLSEIIMPSHNLHADTKAIRLCIALGMLTKSVVLGTMKILQVFLLQSKLLQESKLIFPPFGSPKLFMTCYIWECKRWSKFKWIPREQNHNYFSDCIQSTLALQGYSLQFLLFFFSFSSVLAEMSKWQCATHR